jgi:hypothetical protein
MASKLWLLTEGWGTRMRSMRQLVDLEFFVGKRLIDKIDER